MNKRWKVTVALITAMLCLVMFGVASAEVVASGDCGANGSNLTWTLDSNGTLTISGTGKMKALAYEEWEDYKDDILNVQIDEGVTSISEDAFGCYYNLTSVSLPSSLVDIGNGAFFSCGLTSVVIPSGVTYIGDSFSECTKLTNVTIPDSVTSIGSYAFDGCTSLTSIAIPSGVTDIGNRAFRDTGLTSIILPQSITIIGDSAFARTNLTSVTIPSSMTYIDDCVFLGCTQLISATIPSSVTSIGYGAFADCPNLTIFGESGTAAETYARENNIPFIATNDEPVQLATPKLSSVSNAAKGITIKWGKVEGAEKYRVYYKTTGGWKKIADTTDTSYTWTKAESNTKYTFTVRCVTADGKTTTSSYDKTGKSITHLAQPKLSSVTNTATGITIKWGKVAGAAKYRVYYKTTGSWKKLTDTTATSYTWTKAKSNTKYTFTVRSMTSTGKTTSAYDATGKSITYLATPKLSSVTNTATGITIKWGAVTGAAKYRVYYKTTGSWKKLTDTKSTSYTWTKAKSSAKYTFTVRSMTSTGKTTSAYDATGKSITYLATPKLSSVKATDTTVTIKWGKVTGAAKYRVYYKTTGSWKKLTDTTSTSYTWTKAKSGTKYTFTVRSMTSTGKTTSAYDAAGKSVTVPLATPRIHDIGGTVGNVTITWGKVAGAEKYRVFYKTTGSWKKLGDTTTNSYTWNISKKGIYYFTVRCVDKAGKKYTSGYDTVGVPLTIR